MKPSKEKSDWRLCERFFMTKTNHILSVFSWVNFKMRFFLPALFVIILLSSGQAFCQEKAYYSVQIGSFYFQNQAEKQLKEFEYLLEDDCNGQLIIRQFKPYFAVPIEKFNSFKTAKQFHAKAARLIPDSLLFTIFPGKNLSVGKVHRVKSIFNISKDQSPHAIKSKSTDKEVQNVQSIREISKSMEIRKPDQDVMITHKGQQQDSKITMDEVSSDQSNNIIENVSAHRSEKLNKEKRPQKGDSYSQDIAQKENEKSAIITPDLMKKKVSEINSGMPRNNNQMVEQGVNDQVKLLEKEKPSFLRVENKSIEKVSKVLADKSINKEVEGKKMKKSGDTGMMEKIVKKVPGGKKVDPVIIISNKELNQLTSSNGEVNSQTTIKQITQPDSMPENRQERKNSLDKVAKKMGGQNDLITEEKIDKSSEYRIFKILLVAISILVVALIILKRNL